MPHWRVVVHALDRTGPPVLARSFLRWALRNRPDTTFDVVAFRGGDLVDSYVRLAPTRVLLDPSEPWDAARPSRGRIESLRGRLRDMAPADGTLLVSVAAAQVLPLLPPGPVATWVVEQGGDLHWLERPVELSTRTTRWLAGSAGTAAALRDRLPGSPEVVVCEEFIERPAATAVHVVANCRLALGAGPDDVLVVGAGIATPRKGVDLFLEAALLASRRGLDGLRFAWIGGERDDLFWKVREESERLGLTNLRWFGSVPDVEPWLAAADVFLHTARLDAFPLVCLHAAAAGTPVVAFRGAGGVEEMFGEAFLGAPYPDLDALLDQVEHLATPDRRTGCGDAQGLRVRSRFVDDVAAPSLMAQLDELLRPPAPRSSSPTP